MKKTFFYGITAAMAITVAASPLSAMASEGSSLSEQLKQNGYAVLVKEANSPEEVKEILSKLEGELGSLNWEECFPELGTPEGGVPETPENPEIPETPETPGTGTPEVPENPGNGTPDIDTPETENPEEDDGTTTFAEQVVNLVNAERAKAGLKALQIDEKVAAAANVRAKEIKQSFSHTRPNGSSFSTALKEQGVSYRGSGENIAYGQLSPEAVMNGWMNSDGHRANILNANFTHIGVGHFQDGNGTNYWAQLFTY